MKNLKKLVLLLSIIAAFAIGCKNSQEAVNASFEVVEDGTAEPSTPPVDIKPKPDDKRKPFPGEGELYFNRTDIYNVVSQGSWGTVYTVEVTGSNDEVNNLIKRAKFTNQNSFAERTRDVASPSDVLKAITFRAGPRENLKVVTIEPAMFDALGAKGQYAKVKMEVFIEDTKTTPEKETFKPGSRVIYVSVKKN